METYFDVLIDLGYDLKDHGDHWRTKANFRNGDNQTAIKIYKNSGVWNDFSHGTKAKPFKALIQQTLGKTNISKYEIKEGKYEGGKLLSDEKIFPEDCLGRLLPDYDYFLHKEEEAPIFKQTQQTYQAGLATNGKMYNRMIFPIRNKDGAIHGFSGRDVSGRSTIKWLHQGKTNNWLYPYYAVEECREEIQSRQKLYLVESIGDSMACYQGDCPNTIVSFTNNISPRLAARIAALNVDVIVALNNDFSKPINKNAGLQGGVNSFLKLYQLMDLKKLWFHPPENNTDFGEMYYERISEHFSQDMDHEEQVGRILKLVSDGLQPAASLKTALNKLRKEYKFIYG